MFKVLSYMDSLAIARSSPLYRYWQTNQDSSDDYQRILIANKKSQAVYLLTKEPYKWENLYQSIVREINQGDISSIKAFHVLLDTLNNIEANKLKKNLRDENVFSDNIYKLIHQSNKDFTTSKKNPLRFVKILFAIFTNPYNIPIKGQKKHLYEKTGWFILNLKKIFIKNYRSKDLY